jgi:hypothetical protein
MKKNNDEIVPWKTYLTTTFQTISAFYIATFCFAVFFTRSYGTGISIWFLMTALYLTVIGICVTRIIQRFSMAALMIVIPIAPFLALTSVVSLIPVLEMLK